MRVIKPTHLDVNCWGTKTWYNAKKIKEYFNFGYTSAITERVDGPAKIFAKGVVY